MNTNTPPTTTSNISSIENQRNDEIDESEEDSERDEKDKSWERRSRDVKKSKALPPGLENLLITKNIHNVPKGAQSESARPQETQSERPRVGAQLGAPFVGARSTPSSAPSVRVEESVVAVVDNSRSRSR